MSHDAGVAFDPDRPNDLERRARLLDANRVAVETHEAGHIAVAREWGPSRDRAMASRTPLAAVEGMVVDEAVSDLFAAARTDSPNLGVRTLDAMQPEWYSLETLRRSWVGVADPTSIDVHRGTQLLTKPMIHVLEHAGGDRLAEVTGAAVRAVGRSFADGSRTNVTIPEMATALLDATTNRFGPTSDVVGRVRDGWRALHVLR